jgi:hypothetical protein
MTNLENRLEEMGMRSWVLGNPDAAVNEIIRLRAQQSPPLPPDAVERVREALEHYASDLTWPPQNALYHPSLVAKKALALLAAANKEGS